MKTETRSHSSRTPEQIKFMDMLNELEARFGFNRSRIARECEFSPAIVTAVEKGERSPRYALEKLKQFYQMLVKPGSLDRPPVAVFPDAVHEMLHALKVKDFDAYDLVRSTIEFLHSRIGTAPSHAPARRGRKPGGSRAEVERIAEAAGRRALEGLGGKSRR